MILREDFGTGPLPDLPSKHWHQIFPAEAGAS